jgi:hypothetical protein
VAGAGTPIRHQWYAIAGGAGTATRLRAPGRILLAAANPVLRSSALLD